MLWCDVYQPQCVLRLSVACLATDCKEYWGLVQRYGGVRHCEFGRELTLPGIFMCVCYEVQEVS